MQKLSKVLTFLLLVALISTTLVACVDEMESVQLDMPVNVRVEVEESIPWLRWDAVENANGYAIEIKGAQEPLSEPIRFMLTATFFALDILWYKPDIYTINVRAVGGRNWSEMIEYTDSHWSEAFTHIVFSE